MDCTPRGSKTTKLNREGGGKRGTGESVCARERERKRESYGDGEQASNVD